MTHELVLDIYGFLAWTFIAVICGMFFGVAVYAFFCHWFETRGYSKPDHDENQNEADKVFARLLTEEQAARMTP